MGQDIKKRPFNVKIFGPFSAQTAEEEFQTSRSRCLGSFLVHLEIIQFFRTEKRTEENRRECSVSFIVIAPHLPEKILK